MKKSILIAVALILITSGYFFFFFTNFHEVDHGVLYRSKQMTAAQLDNTIKRYGIKTVINLRGASPDDDWYRDELRVSKDDHAEHLDFRLSATHYLAPKSLDSLVTMVASAPKPVLVHCQGGADRTGLFCAAWKLKIDKSSPEKASEQLSVLYGHIPYIYDKTEEMDRSFADYTRFVRSRN